MIDQSKTAATQDNISYQDLVRSLCKKSEELLREWTADPVRAHLVHMSSKLVSEAVELTEGLFRHLNYGHPIEIHGNEGLLKESGDVEFYLEGICGPLGIDGSPECKPYIQGNMIAPTILAHANGVSEVIFRNVFYGSPIDTGVLTNAIRDLRGSLLALYDSVGISREDVLKANTEKLLKRFGGLSFNNEAAINRIDKQ